MDLESVTFLQARPALTLLYLVEVDRVSGCVALQIVCISKRLNGPNHTETFPMIFIKESKEVSHLLKAVLAGIYLVHTRNL